MTSITKKDQRDAKRLASQTPRLKVVGRQFIVEGTHPNFHLAHLKRALADQMCEVRELNEDEVIYKI
jgi:hypothetical protein